MGKCSVLSRVGQFAPQQGDFECKFSGWRSRRLGHSGPHLAGGNLQGTAYASAGAWAVNGVANLVRAIRKSDATIANRVLTGASGLANAAGAALAAASVSAAAENKSDDAVKLATASGAMWLAGSAAEAAAAWADRRRSKLLDSEQLVATEGPAAGPVRHASEHHAEHVDTDPGATTNAPAETSSHLRHLHAHYERGDATGHVVEAGPESDAYSHHSPHPGSSLPKRSANDPAETPPHGLHHLHGQYVQADTTGHAVVIEANATHHNSMHSNTVGGASTNEPASTTGNTGKAKYDQRTRDRSKVDR